MPNADRTDMFLVLLILYIIMAAPGYVVNRARTKWLRSAAITADDLEELERLSSWREARLAAWKAGRIGWVALMFLAMGVFGFYIGGFFLFAVLVVWALAWYAHVMARVEWRRLRQSARDRLKADEGKRRFLWMAPAAVAILCIGWPAYVGIQDGIEYQRRAAPVVADSGRSVLDQIKPLKMDPGTAEAVPEAEVEVEKPEVPEQKELTDYDVRFYAAWDRLELKYPDLADDKSTFYNLLIDKADAAIARGDPAVEDPEHIIKFADELASMLAIEGNEKLAMPIPEKTAPGKSETKIFDLANPDFETRDDYDKYVEYLKALKSKSYIEFFIASKNAILQKMEIEDPSQFPQLRVFKISADYNEALLASMAGVDWGFPVPEKLISSVTNWTATVQARCKTESEKTVAADLLSDVVKFDYINRRRAGFPTNKDTHLLDIELESDEEILVSYKHLNPREKLGDHWRGVRPDGRREIFESAWEEIEADLEASTIDQRDSILGMIGATGNKEGEAVFNDPYFAYHSMYYVRLVGNGFALSTEERAEFRRRCNLAAAKTRSEEEYQFLSAFYGLVLRADEEARKAGK